MELLHNYIFIPLDIFRKKHQNEHISTELDRNTVDYMIDKLKRSNEQLQDRITQLQEELDSMRKQLHEQAKQ